MISGLGCWAHSCAGIDDNVTSLHNAILAELRCDVPMRNESGAIDIMQLVLDGDRQA
jgi:hypothetical protein